MEDQDHTAGDLTANDDRGDAASSLAAGGLSSDARAAVSPAEEPFTPAGLFAEHGEAVFGFCFRQVRDKALAEDLMQQVFLEACRDLHGFRKQSSVRTWLFAIAGNRCIDALRRKDRTVRRMVQADEAAAEVADPAAGAFEKLERRQLFASLDECLQGLSPDTRATVLLRFQTDLTYDEMADRLGATSYALQMRVSRAMPALLDCLERKGWTDE